MRARGKWAGVAVDQGNVGEEDAGGGCGRGLAEGPDMNGTDAVE